MSGRGDTPKTNMELGPEVKKHQEHQPALDWGGCVGGTELGTDAEAGEEWRAKGEGMFFRKGEKGKYETGQRRSRAGKKRAESKEEMGPSIHVLGLWGNLDSLWSFLTLSEPLSGPTGMKGRPGQTLKRILNASDPRGWGRERDREVGGGEG